MQREYPDSLLFLEPALADATIAQNEQSRVLETFLTNPSADEVDIVVQNVSLSELAKPPYKASVSFQKLLYSPGTRQERARQTFIAQIDFSLRDHVPNEFVRVNPLGLQISYFRVDQAFEEGRPMIANVAFLAALTTFLAVAWLAGELSFLAPYKAGIFRHHGVTIGAGDPGALPEPVRRVLRHRSLALPPRHRPEAVAHGPATGVARRRPARPPSGLEGVGAAACGVTSILVRRA